MRMLVATVAFLGACAGPPVAPEPAAGVPSGTRAILSEPAPLGHAASLVKRLEGIDLGTLTADWPRRSDLPKPERGYDAAFAGEDLACDGWRYDILVDLECPRAVWVRAIGTIVGIREYRGPAEIVDDSGPLVFRVGE